MGGPGGTLLVIEDDDEARSALVGLLGAAGYAVAPAAHGQEALALLGGGLGPDLILLDMLLPVLDGWRFLEQLRVIDPRRQIPVLLTTGNICIGPEWARAHGCAGLLPKPIVPEALLEEVRRCLATPPGPGGG